jgi:hypothetical protein
MSGFIFSNDQSVMSIPNPDVLKLSWELLSDWSIYLTVSQWLDICFSHLYMWQKEKWVFFSEIVSNILRYFHWLRKHYWRVCSNDQSVMSIPNPDVLKLSWELLSDWSIYLTVSQWLDGHWLVIWKYEPWHAPKCNVDRD